MIRTKCAFALLSIRCIINRSCSSVDSMRFMQITFIHFRNSVDNVHRCFKWTPVCSADQPRCGADNAKMSELLANFCSSSAAVRFTFFQYFFLRIGSVSWLSPIATMHRCKAREGILSSAIDSYCSQHTHAEQHTAPMCWFPCSLVHVCHGNV